MLSASSVFRSRRPHNQALAYLLLNPKEIVKRTLQMTISKNIILTLLITLTFHALAQDYRIVENNSFSRGEHLEYNVYWDAWLLPKMIAGTATLQIMDENRRFHSRSTYHVVGTGFSKGVLNMFYKVEDRYETYIDENALIPWYFLRRTKEGSYVRDDDVVFDQIKNIARGRYATREVPANIQDIISAVYYARTFDFDSARKGDVFPFDFFLDDSVYISQVVFQGQDTIKSYLGLFSCLKFKPMVLVGPVFSEPYPMTVWVTNDKNRIPVRVESKVLVGKVKIELSSFSGLSNPLTAKLK